LLYSRAGEFFTSNIMNKWVIIIALLLSIAGAIINNIFSNDPVDWMGSPQVFEKPDDL